MEKKLQDYLTREGGDALASIRDKREITEENAELLKKLLTTFVERVK